MNNLRIIAMTGEKGSGKDTVSKIINRLYPESKRYALGYPMKKVARDLFFWGKEHTDGDLKEVVDPHWEISPRRFLQEIGTFMRTSLGEYEPTFEKLNRQDFWCRHLSHEMAYPPRDDDFIYIITDIRYPNEIDYFRRISDDCCLIKIKRDAKIYSEDSHPSETSFDQLHPDFVIDNNGTLEELEEKTKTILRILGVL